MIFEFFSTIVANLLSLVNQMGYWGIFIGMVLESTVFPLPSEFILLPAGALIADGKFSFLPVFFASIFGSVLGALINYSLALFLGRKTVDLLVSKYGKFVFVSKRGLDSSERFFKSYGNISTFTGRLIPVVRHLISIPAGFFRMDLKKFIFFTAIGSALWTCILLGIGYFFQNIASTILNQNPFLLYLTSFVVCLIVLIVYLIMRQKK